jgi:hypothetical protein
MTTEQDGESESASKPQVIDLEAEDVTASASHDNPDPKPTPLPPRRKKSQWRWAAMALVAGLIAGGWLYRGYLARYLPTAEMTTLEARLATLEANAKTSRDQLLAVSQTAEQANQTAASLDASIKGTAQGVETLKNTLGNTGARLDELQKSLDAAKADIDKLRQAVTTGNGGAPADSATLALIGQRLDALEKDVASLKAGSAPSEDQTAVSALRQSLSDIQAKIASGAPYRDELDRITRVVPAVGGNDVLNAYADHGLANAAALAAEVRELIPTLPKPDSGKAPESSGYLDSFWNAISSVVTIRDVGESDWPALAENCAKLAEANNLEGAIAAVDKAQGVKPSAIQAWRDKAQSRLQLETALAELTKQVNLVIAAKGGGQ